MAPTHFYPLIVGPEVGPSESQAAATIIKHMTNPVRFAVWPSGDPPTDHPPPIDGTRPLVAFAQWYAGVGRNHTEEPLRRLWLQRTSAPFNAKAPYCPSCCSGGT